MCVCCTFRCLDVGGVLSLFQYRRHVRIDNLIFFFSFFFRYGLELIYSNSFFFFFFFSHLLSICSRAFLFKQRGPNRQLTRKDPVVSPFFASSLHIRKNMTHTGVCVCVSVPYLLYLGDQNMRLVFLGYTEESHKRAGNWFPRI